MQPARQAEPAPSLDDLRELCADDLAGLDRLIQESLHTDVALVSDIAQYIVSAGGKRLRPLIVMLASRALAPADQRTGAPDRRSLQAAAIIEFIHTATLLHDDVVDGSERRRGRDTANAVFGNQASVLVGDFLYSRAFQMMVAIGDMRVMRVLADATNTIAAGEVMQLMNVHDPDTTEDQYRQVIYRKTARLFEAGAEIAALLTDQSPEVQASLGRYGRELGTAFQLIDDALDYSASADELGKNVGDDLAEGKPTLPLIHAIATGGAAERQLIREAIAEGGVDRLPEILKAIESTGALEYTRARAEEAARAAVESIAVLPPSAYRDALAAIAEFSVARRF
ncbi:MAG: polyprenyl synthetase family protein [Pseudomonadota bacterium]